MPVRGVSEERRTRAEVFDGPVPIAACRYAISEPVPAHVHDFVELALVTRGTVDHATATGVSRLGPGDLVVIRPGAWHAYVPTDGGADVVNTYLGAELVAGQLSWVLDHPQFARLLLLGGALAAPLGPAPRGRLVGWLDQLAEELHDGDPVIKSGLIACVLIELARTEERYGPRVPMISTEVRTGLQTMTDDLARGWTVRELGQVAGLSASSLYRRFRAELGTGPVEWLARTRAEAAATLLVQTDLPVAAIGRRVGWSDPSYASRRFTQVYGVAPTTYRSQHAARGPVADDV